MKYKLYENLAFFGCDPDWERMRRIDKVREEINEQLDVRLVLKKLNYLDRVAEVLLD